MKFEMTHLQLKGAAPEVFTETSAPDWLTGANTYPGSTMDLRWFWERHVLTLAVGSSVDTCFRRVRRVE
jgi:hypothetical protein